MYECNIHHISIIMARCCGLRVRDESHNWRIDNDAVLILAVFAKMTPKTLRPIIEACKARLSRYDRGE